MAPLIVMVSTKGVAAAVVGCWHAHTPLAIERGTNHPIKNLRSIYSLPRIVAPPAVPALPPPPRMVPGIHHAAKSAPAMRAFNVRHPATLVRRTLRRSLRYGRITAHDVCPSTRDPSAPSGISITDRDLIRGGRTAGSALVARGPLVVVSEATGSTAPTADACSLHCPSDHRCGDAGAWPVDRASTFASRFDGVAACGVRSSLNARPHRGPLRAVTGPQTPAEATGFHPPCARCR